MFFKLYFTSSPLRSIDHCCLHHVYIRKQSAVQLYSSTTAEGPNDPSQAVYWDSLANVLPKAKLQTWTALESALDKYL